MAEKIKKDDFIELNYSGRLKDTGDVFDTTDEDLAKKEGIFDPKMTYGSISICVGQGQILRGLDTRLEGLEVGIDQEVILAPENAFGNKDGRLIKLVPTSVFKKQNINPVRGLQLNIDGSIGTIRTVTGGRTVVDFNHPFSGKDIVYAVHVKRKITDDKEKVLALIGLALNTKDDSIGVTITDGKASIALQQEFAKELLDILKERVINLISSIKEVEFKLPEKKSPAPEKDAQEDKVQEKAD